MYMRIQTILLLIVSALFAEAINQIRNFKEGDALAPTEEELSERSDMGFGKPRKFREENSVLILVIILVLLVMIYWCSTGVATDTISLENMNACG